jgi:hypothetical protein
MQSENVYCDSLISISTLRSLSKTCPLVRVKKPKRNGTMKISNVILQKINVYFKYEK